VVRDADGRTVTVLAHHDDPGGTRLARALTERGVVRVRLVSDFQLGLAVWRDEPQLPGGPITGLVHNRLRSVPPVRFARAGESEQAYAAAELHALALSWLASLGDDAVNRPSPLGLAGRERSRLEWLVLASGQGLPVADAVLTSSARRVPAGTGARRGFPSPLDEPTALPPPDPVPAGRRPALFLDCPDPRRALVAGGRVHGGDPGLAALADAAGCDVLEVLVRPDGAVLGATPLPALDDPAHVVAVAALLERRAS
jgi:hypothetical protein